MKFWVKVHRVGNEIMIAFCDEKLLEKTLNFGDVKIKISKEFYGESLIDDKALKEMLKNATIINAFGKNAIEILEKEGFISKTNILLVDGVPHAQYAKV